MDNVEHFSNKAYRIIIHTYLYIHNCKYDLSNKNNQGHQVNKKLKFVTKAV